MLMKQLCGWLDEISQFVCIKQICEIWKYQWRMETRPVAKLQDF